MKHEHSHIDPATGRNKRELGGMARNQRNRERDGTTGAIRRWNGKPAESRVEWRRRNRVQGRRRAR